MKRNLLTSLLLLTIHVCHAQIITTIAGTGIATYGGDGGPATAASFWSNKDIDIDWLGNIYIADYDNSCIRKIDHSGIITTFAGRGTPPLGSIGDGGPATAATLNDPTDVKADSKGNVYIADNTNFRIRKVDAAGIITTIAGGGSTLGDGGPATAAQVYPWGIAIDAIGNVYCTEHSRVRKIDATTGIITTIAGNGTPGYTGDGGPATAAQLNYPWGITVDMSGNIYIADINTNCVRMVNTLGIISTVAGTGTAGYIGDGMPATATELNQPTDVTIDAYGNLYICDAGNYRLRKVNSTGSKIINTVAGTGTAGYSGDGHLATLANVQVGGVAVDCGTNLYISDGVNNRLRKITYIHTPLYTAEGSDLQVCENSGPLSINSLLAVTDSDTGQTLNWSLVATPPNGAVGGMVYSMLTTGGAITPTGLTYTPSAGYTGADSFTVLVSYCGSVSTTIKVYVTVNPLPVVNAITGTDSVCSDSGKVTLSNTTAGGVWSLSGVGASIGPVSGVVTGISKGAVTASYTVTTLGCSTSVSYPVNVVTCPTGVTAPGLPLGEEVLRVYPNPVAAIVHIDGLQAQAHYRLLDMVGSLIGEGILQAGDNRVSVKALPQGLYMIEVSNDAGAKTVRKIVKE